ncbi:MAG TPA: septal ring lytic transglycosylase RlpA family protein [Alphaproteobacteria bacterium]|nr:septal ring lytic transglycosylase RlpA family protein [Alphaproteobacteria bacterium]
MRSFSWSFATLVALVFLVASAFAFGESKTDKPLEQHGTASYYSDRFNHKETASGADYSRSGMTAASPSLPLGTKAKVINKETGKSVDVKVNDRGPHKRGRIIDLSHKAAQKLGMKKDGVAPVEVQAKPSAQPTPELQRKIEEKAAHQK